MQRVVTPESNDKNELNLTKSGRKYDKIAYEVIYTLNLDSNETNLECR